MSPDSWDEEAKRLGVESGEVLRNQVRLANEVIQEILDEEKEGDMDDKAFEEKCRVAQLKYFHELTGLSAEETAKLLIKFAGLCRQIDKINEKDCNEGLSEKDKSREKLLVDQAREVADKLKCKLHHQGDPRGPAIRLIRPDGRSNLMDGETWEVRL